MLESNLTLANNIVNFGDQLLKDCPDNDCVIFKNTYKQYKSLCGDYESYSELSEPARRAIRTEIHRIKADLLDMWMFNYAVLKHRELC